MDSLEIENNLIMIVEGLIQKGLPFKWNVKESTLRINWPEFEESSRSYLDSLEDVHFKGVEVLTYLSVFMRFTSEIIDSDKASQDALMYLRCACELFEKLGHNILWEVLSLSPLLLDKAKNVLTDKEDISQYDYFYRFVHKSHASQSYDAIITTARDMIYKKRNTHAVQSHLSDIEHINPIKNVKPSLLYDYKATIRGPGIFSIKLQYNPKKNSHNVPYIESCSGSIGGPLSGFFFNFLSSYFYGWNALSLFKNRKVLGLTLVERREGSIVEFFTGHWSNILVAGISAWTAIALHTKQRTLTEHQIINEKINIFERLSSIGVIDGNHEYLHRFLSGDAKAITALVAGQLEDELGLKVSVYDKSFNTIYKNGKLM